MVPVGLVTVRVKVLAAVMVPLPKAVPLVTPPTLLFTLPVPLLKVGVMRVLPPKGTGLVVATRLLAVGRATTVTVVLADLEPSSVEVAVMVTDPVKFGAVQAPVLGFMVPAVADQVMPLVRPPVAVAAKVVALRTSLVARAGLGVLTTTVWGVTVTVEVAWVLPPPVTVRVKVLAVVMVPLENATPLVTAPMPWSTLPVPLLKVGVMVVLPP